MNIQSVLLFEPESAESIYPHSIMHTWWEIRCGYFRLFEKLQRLLPEQRIIFQSDELRLRSFLARHEHASQSILRENMLILNSAILPTRELFDEMSSRLAEENSEGERAVIFSYRSLPFALFMPASELLNPLDADRSFLPSLLMAFREHYHKIEIENANPISFLWDAIELCPLGIATDFVLASGLDDSKFKRYPDSHLINREDIIIGVGTEIGAGAVIDASGGPVIIGANARIMPNAVLAGPCAIGDGSTIKIGAKIYEGTAIGPVSKVGGEVEASIIQGYSNKQHDGFLGHSYIGEWVNLGADTNTSDLKNNYGMVSARLRGRTIPTGRQFLGMLAGDHTKTGINTMLNTGTVAGLSCNIFGAGYPDKSIRSFTWGESDVYDFAKAVEVARTVMQRRGKELLAEELALFEREWKLEREAPDFGDFACSCGCHSADEPED